MTPTTVDYATIFPLDDIPQQTQSCHRAYPNICQCRRYGPRANNPCDAVDSQLVELSPRHHRTSHRPIAGLAEGIPVSSIRPLPNLSHEERREIARLTGTHYGPVSRAVDPETGLEQPDRSVQGYRYRHPYITREASGAVPVADIPYTDA